MNRRSLFRSLGLGAIVGGVALLPKAPQIDHPAMTVPQPDPQAELSGYQIQQVMNQQPLYLSPSDRFITLTFPTVSGAIGYTVTGVSNGTNHEASQIFYEDHGQLRMILNDRIVQRDPTTGGWVPV